MQKEGESTPPTVVPATIPSWEVTDTALTESTASEAVRTGFDGIVNDGHFAESSPILRKPVLVVGRIQGDRGDKRHDKLVSAGIVVELLIVQTGRLTYL